MYSKTTCLTRKIKNICCIEVFSLLLALADVFSFVFKEGYKANMNEMKKFSLAMGQIYTVLPCSAPSFPFYFLVRWFNLYVRGKSIFLVQLEKILKYIEVFSTVFFVHFDSKDLTKLTISDSIGAKLKSLLLSF